MTTIIDQRNLVLSIEGEEATWKTTTALTAPLKIVCFCFDLGTARAIAGPMWEKYFGGLSIETFSYIPGEVEPKWADYDITIYELPVPMQLDEVMVAGCVELWNYFIILLGKAFRDPNVSTIIVDTMTVARRVKADAHLQGLQQDSIKWNQTHSADKQKNVREKLLQVEYGTPNDAMRDIWHAGAGTKKNFIGIHHLTDEREDRIDPRSGEIKQGIITGKRILEGLSSTHRFVDVAIRLEKQGKKVKAKYVKCGYNLDLEDEYLPVEPTWDRITNTIETSLGDRIKFQKRNHHA